MSPRVYWVLYATIGWAICGIIIAVGRYFIAIQATLWLHAFLAPLVFAALSWRFFARFPEESIAATALAMVLVVVGLDALIVAPVFERSYAMFLSILGTWAPLVLIATAITVAGRISRRTVS